MQVSKWCRTFLCRQSQVEGGLPDCTAAALPVQGLIPAPYDTLLHKQSAAAAAGTALAWQPAAAPIHVETEHDHPQHALHHSPPAADAALPARIAAKPLQVSDPSNSQPTTPRAFLERRYHDKDRSKKQSSVAAEEDKQLIKLQLSVVPAVVSDSSSSGSSGGGGGSSVSQQLVVQLHLVVPGTCNNNSNGIKTSSSSFLGSRAGAVRGLLQGLHHSASAGLQQSTAAGQEISGAVAAAGGAVAAAISNPFAAVRSFAGKAQRKVESSKAAAPSSESLANTAAEPPASEAGAGTAQEPAATGQVFYQELGGYVASISQSFQHMCSQLLLHDHPP